MYPLTHVYDLSTMHTYMCMYMYTCICLTCLHVYINITNKFCTQGIHLYTPIVQNQLFFHLFDNWLNLYGVNLLSSYKW